jgi:hypothetical protein
MFQHIKHTIIFFNYSRSPADFSQVRIIFCTLDILFNSNIKRGVSVSLTVPLDRQKQPSYPRGASSDSYISFVMGKILSPKLQLNPEKGSGGLVGGVGWGE